MIKLNLTKFKKEFKKAEKFPKILAEKSFLTFFILFIVFFIFGLIVFYYYYFSIDFSGHTVRLLRIDTETQSRVLEEWEERNKKLEKISEKKYPDPFQPINFSPINNIEKEED